MKIFYTDHYVLPLPAGHRFPMAKYSLLRKRVEEAGLSGGEGLREPHAATDGEILRAHDRAYLECVVNGQLSARELRRIGFPWTPQMVERSRRSAGATIEACRAALAEGVGVNLAGGTHHAFRDHGEGYCVFNDSAIAALAMQAEGRARRVAILDCDVHQGNGTASILAGDPTVFTRSTLRKISRSVKRLVTSTSNCRTAPPMLTTSMHWNRASAARFPLRSRTWRSILPAPIRTWVTGSGGFR